MAYVVKRMTAGSGSINSSKVLSCFSNNVQKLCNRCSYIYDAEKIEQNIQRAARARQQIEADNLRIENMIKTCAEAKRNFNINA